MINISEPPYLTLPDSSLPTVCPETLFVGPKEVHAPPTEDKD